MFKDSLAAYCGETPSPKVSFEDVPDRVLADVDGWYGLRQNAHVAFYEFFCLEEIHLPGWEAFSTSQLGCSLALKAAVGHPQQKALRLTTHCRGGGQLPAIPTIEGRVDRMQTDMIPATRPEAQAGGGEGIPHLPGGPHSRHEGIVGESFKKEKPRVLSGLEVIFHEKYAAV
ncbi:hypothetical protein CPLU01_10977 [Colletotrichum plurivorum]|uniref:Uncharacterized protein n=1 Tax=Colletotrichum plurivorum TaxID=2175906 RepID=A0A8H6K4F5_9PEZI|nr:hypothetical protein CPLU01_10977 [Colletotrichum plurivorum]